MKSASHMESFIVRIYRRHEDDPRGFVGIVEETGVEGKQAFHSMDELAAILNWKTYNPAEKRKTGRLRLKLPVTVEGKGSGKRKFSEKTTLKDISPAGAYLFLENQISTGDPLSIHIDPGHSNLQMNARVARLEESTNKKGVGLFFE